jgi:hypothetical protein
VGVGEPGRALVVEVREGALRELGLAEAERVQPAVAEEDELRRDRGDRLALGVGGVGEGEGLEARRRGIAGPRFELRPRREGPELMDAGVEAA